MPTYSIRAPDGKTYTVTGPKGATEAQVRAEVLRQHPQAAQPAKKDNSALGGFLAGAVKPIDNLATWASGSPVGKAVDDFGARLGFPRTADAVRGNEAARRNNTRTGWQLTGNIAGTLPTLAVRNPIVQGMLGGALLTDDTSLKGTAKAAAIGGVAGKLGDVAGRRIIAPGLERVGRTAPVRAASAATLQVANKLLGTKAKPLPLPKFTPAEKRLPKVSPTATRNVEDAARLNLPFSLADASPELRSLAGSVSRFSPQARNIAEEAYGPRAAGINQRAINAMDEHLAPVTDIAARSGQITQAARAQAAPLYDEALSMPAPVDDVLSDLLQRPAGQEAFRRAQIIAANEGVDLSGPATYRTLDYTKRGLDSVLNDSRSPLDGKLHIQGDDVAKSVNQTLQEFRARLDELNPVYREARAAYQEGIAPRTALETGFNVLPKNSVPTRDLNRALESIAPENLPEAARGYVTARADEVSRMAQGNPYKAVYSSLDEQSKMRSLFPEEGVANFDRMAALEREMGKTYTETLGGSATQPRAVADAQFAGVAPDVIGAGVDLATGSPFSAAANIARRGMGANLSDRWSLGFGAQKKADQLAPLMFNTDPRFTLQALLDYNRKQAEMQARMRAYQNIGGTLGLPAVAAGVAGSD